MRGKTVLSRARLAAASFLLGSASIANAAEPPVQPVELSEMQAQEPPQGQEPSATQSATTTEKSAATKKKWEFSTIGYGWFAGAKVKRT